MKLVIVIPAYNEEQVIGEVLRSLPKKLLGIKRIVILVVNDGSVDKTAKIAKRNGAIVVTHIINQGLGSALSTGLEAAKLLDVDIAITFDGDGQHNPAEIKKIIKPILLNKADLVVGCRMINPKGMPLIKILGNIVMNFITYILLGTWSRDTQSGMRAFSRKAIDNIIIHSRGYEVSSEIIGEAKKKKLDVLEVPIKAIYTKYSIGKGQNIFNGANILFKLLLMRLER